MNTEPIAQSSAPQRGPKTVEHLIKDYAKYTGCTEEVAYSDIHNYIQRVIASGYTETIAIGRIQSWMDKNKKAAYNAGKKQQLNEYFSTGKGKDMTCAQRREIMRKNLKK